MNAKKQNNQGFTIIELLLVMVISSVVMIGIWNTFQFQHRSYALQRQIVAMEQNLRAGMEFMSTEIRIAGYDPNGSADAGIVMANSDLNTIRITMDINNDADTENYDGDINDKNEDITYALYDDPTDGIRKLGRTTGGVRQPVAEYINSLTFAYLDADGNVPATQADVRSVKIMLEAMTANTNPTRFEQLETHIRCRNLGL